MNKNLQKAKKEKNDEFYTQLTDIEKELGHYIKHFKNKIVFCNCDSKDSNFYKYFNDNFELLSLKKLFISHIDFRSPECIEILKECDIVVTNPPFSLFREYVGQLIDYKKKFIIIGNLNAITYKEVFSLIKNNKLWLGNTKPKEFLQPNKEIKKFGNICWFTNLNIKKRNEELILYQKYNKKDYPKYDNYDAINIDKVKDIPMGYEGVMGVPITFLDKHNPKQFEIMKCSAYSDDKCFGCPALYLNRKKKYARILIKRCDI